MKNKAKNFLHDWAFENEERPREEKEYSEREVIEIMLAWSDREITPEEAARNYNRLCTQ